MRSHIESLEPRRHLSTSLDTSFAEKGIYTLPGTVYSNGTQSLIQSPDGAVFTYLGDNSTLVKIDSRGKSQKSVKVDLGNFGTLQRSRLLAASDNKLTLVVFTGSTYAVYRYNLDLTLDATFSPLGVGFTFAPTTATVSAYEAWLNPQNGTVVIAAAENLGTFGAPKMELQIVAINAKGDLVSSPRAVIQNHCLAQGLAITPSGKVIVGGDFVGASSTTKAQFLERFTLDGKLDPTFSRDGVVKLNLNNTGPTATCVAVQPDGKILFGGRNHPPDRDLLEGAYSSIARFTTTGALDTSFGGDGIVDVSIAKLQQIIPDPASQKLYMIGDHGDSVINRMRPTGKIDYTWHFDGFFEDQISDFVINRVPDQPVQLIDPEHLLVAGTNGQIARVLTRPQEYIVGGTLVLAGTEADDKISVQYDGFSTLDVQRNGEKSSYLFHPQIKALEIYGYGGNDILKFPSELRTFIDAGSGNDNVTAYERVESLPASTATIYGGLGNDFIESYAGQQELFGGSGRDTLSAGSGDDYLSAGAGADILYGGAGRDAARADHLDTRVSIETLL